MALLGTSTNPVASFSTIRYPLFFRRSTFVRSCRQDLRIFFHLARVRQPGSRCSSGGSIVRSLSRLGTSDAEAVLSVSSLLVCGTNSYISLASAPELELRSTTIKERVRRRVSLPDGVQYERVSLSQPGIIRSGSSGTSVGFMIDSMHRSTSQPNDGTSSGHTSVTSETTLI